MKVWSASAQSGEGGNILPDSEDEFMRANILKFSSVLFPK